jgi:hypothetical protein
MRIIKLNGCAIPLVLLALASQGIAAEVASPRVEAFEGKVRAKDWQTLAVDPAQARRYVEITRDVELSCQTKGDPSSARSVTVLKGVYPIERRLHSKKVREDWLIVPVVSSQPAVFGYNNSAGRTWGYEHAIALHPNTLAIFPREIVSYTQEWSRLDRSRWNELTWAFGCVPQRVGTADGAAIRFINEAQFQAVRNGKAKEEIRETLGDAQQRKERLNRERPLKSQIGMQLCKESGPVVLQGFTENRSPDNGKIQIRIWRASLSDDGRPSAVVPNDFRESVVWEDPDRWNLCEE